MLLVCLSTMLLLNGYTHHMFGAEADGAVKPVGDAAAVPRSIAGGGPVIDAGDGTPRSVSPHAPVFRFREFTGQRVTGSSKSFDMPISARFG